MISFFIDGMYHDYMKMKIMRDKLRTLQEAITVATDEQNLRRFDLRSVTTLSVVQITQILAPSQWMFAPECAVKILRSKL